MKVEKTKIDGLLIITPEIFKDDRGYFFESFNQDKFKEETGIDVNFVQDNESESSMGVLRGLHFQVPPYSQTKLVRVVKGNVFDVAVDLRKGSPTYGEHVSVILNENNHKQFFIPKGFAHGFCTISDKAIFQYKCDEYYAPGHEGGIIYNDKTINIDWPLVEKDLILSSKDLRHNTLENFETPFVYE